MRARPHDVRTPSAATTVVTFGCSEPGRGHVRRPRRAERARGRAQRPRASTPPTPSRRRPHRAARPRRRQRAARRRGLPRTSRTGEGLHRFVDPVDRPVYLYTQFEAADARGSSPASTSPTSRRPSQLTVTAPAALAGRLQLPHARAAADLATGRPLGVRRRRRASRRTSPRSSPGRTTSVRDEYVRADGPTIPLGVFCRASLARAPRRRRRSSTSPSRASPSSRSSSAAPYPFDEVRPALRAGVQRRRHGERRLRDLPRGHTSSARKVTDAVDERRANTILHEMAHMWFGDLVTMRWWDDLWLNESFAEYVAYHCQRRGDPLHRRPGPTSPPGASPGRTARTSCRRPTRSPPTSPTSETVKMNFDGITYAKGASRAAPARRVGRRRAVHGRGPHLLGPPRLGQHHPRATCSPSWSASPAATCRPGRRSGWRRPAATPLRPAFEVGRRTARTPSSPSPRRPRATTPRCARTASASACTTAPTTGSCCRDRIELDLVGAGDRGAAAGRRARSRTCCCSTTTTSPSPRSASTSARCTPPPPRWPPSTTRSPGRCCGPPRGT